MLDKREIRWSTDNVIIGNRRKGEHVLLCIAESRLTLEIPITLLEWRTMAKAVDNVPQSEDKFDAFYDDRGEYYRSDKFTFDSSDSEVYSIKNYGYSRVIEIRFYYFPNSKNVVLEAYSVGEFAFNKELPIAEMRQFFDSVNLD